MGLWWPSKAEVFLEWVTYKVVPRKQIISGLVSLSQIQYLHGLMKQMQKIQISGTVLYEDEDNNIPEPSSAASGNAFGGQHGDSLKGYGEMRATQSDAVRSGASGQAPKNRKF